MSADCKHKDFEAYVRVNRFEDTGKFMANVTIRCTACKTPFQFLGLDPGLKMAGAAVDLDGLELRIAIVPQGSVPSPIDLLAGPDMPKH